MYHLNYLSRDFEFSWDHDYPEQIERKVRAMITEDLYEKYLGALLAGNRLECTAVVQNLLNNSTEIKEIYENLIKRSMYRVGELWELNQITVANEYLATALTDSLLNLTYPYVFATERTGKKAVIACCVNEFHQIGAKMVVDILEFNGWDSHFLGADTSFDDLLRCIDDVAPDIVGISLCVLPDIAYFKRNIEIMRTDFPNLNLLIGGRAFLKAELGGIDIIGQYPGVEYVSSLHDLEILIKGL
jgi:methanogenic corrinoid protein MtbC1